MSDGRNDERDTNNNTFSVAGDADADVVTSLWSIESTYYNLTTDRTNQLCIIQLIMLGNL